MSFHEFCHVSCDFFYNAAFTGLLEPKFNLSPSFFSVDVSFFFEFRLQKSVDFLFIPMFLAPPVLSLPQVPPPAPSGDGSPRAKEAVSGELSGQLGPARKACWVGQLGGAEIRAAQERVFGKKGPRGRRRV